MSGDDWRRYVVTTDEELLAALWEKFNARSEDGGLDSRGLALYAYTLGLYPPGYEDGQSHSISVVTPFEDGRRRYLVWSIGLAGPDDDVEDDYLDRDDDDDEFAAPGDWGDVVSIVLPDDESKKQ